MSSRRTQLYFTEAQRSAIDARAEREGKTMADVVREATEAYVVGPEAGYLQLDADLLDQVERIASAQGWSAAVLIEDLLRSFLREQQRWDRLFELGATSAAERGVTDEDVVEYIRELRTRGGD